MWQNTSTFIRANISNDEFNQFNQIINTFYHQYLVSCFNTGKLCPYITIFTHFLSNVIWMTLEAWRLSHCCPWSTWDNVWHIVNLDGGTFINSLKPPSSRYNQIHTPAQDTHARFKNRMILWFCKKNQRSLEHIGENYSTFIMRTLRSKCLSLTTSIDLGYHCGSHWVPGTWTNKWSQPDILCIFLISH